MLLITAWPDNHRDRTDDDIKSDSKLIADLDALFVQFNYFGQLERCHSTKRLHFQFIWSNPPRRRFCDLQKPVRDAFSTIGIFCSTPSHFERCVDPPASILYVSKDDTRVIGPFGQKPIYQRKRTHARSDATAGKSDSIGATAISHFDSGGTVLDFVRAHPASIPRLNSLTQLHSLIVNSQSETHINRTCIWIHGAPGTGKSTVTQYFPKPQSNAMTSKPFVTQSYRNPHTYIVDDPCAFNETNATSMSLFDHILVAADNIIRPARRLNGDVQMTHSIFIFITNATPSAQLARIPDGRDVAFLRRFHLIVEFKSRTDIRFSRVVFDPQRSLITYVDF